jgi:elongation factor 2
MNQEGDQTVVKAKLPVAELFGWSSELRSATEGRGNSNLVDQMFEKVPNELQDRVKSQLKERKGLTDAMLGA